MKSLAPTDLAYFESAPVRLVASARIEASPDAVFAKLADAASWIRWFPLMTTATWESGSGGLGAQRAVKLRILGSYREKMIAWEPGVRFAFTMIGSTSPFAQQLAEDYRLRADGKGTVLEWTFAATPSTLGKLAVPGLRVTMKQVFAAAGKRLNAELVA